LSGFDLKAYLDQQRSEGRQDSEGSFTVSSDKAALKLAHFSLPGEYDWVLKIIQAVNAWRADRLLVRQSRLATSFFFEPDHGVQPISTAGFISLLTKGTLNNDSPSHMLCMALRSLVDQVRLSFVLSIRWGDVSTPPIFAGDDTSQLDPKVREKWAALDRDGVRLTVSHFNLHETFRGRYLPSFSFVERRDLKIGDTLRKRGGHSSTPIYLDGQHLSGRDQTGIHRTLMAGLYRQTRPSGLELEAEMLNIIEPSDKIKLAPFTKSHGCKRFYILTTDWRHVHRIEERGGPELFHRVLWIRDGVVIGETALENSSRSTMFLGVLPGNHLRTDLSGLSWDEQSDRARSDARKFAEFSVRAVEELQSSFADLVHRSLPKLETSDKGVEDEPQLRAGFSIFTESLIQPGRVMLNKVQTRLRNVTDPQPPELWVRRFLYWRDLVPKELERVVSDLKKGRIVRR
jgi:hypothetical protein